jgi:hypothetical protein
MAVPYTPLHYLLFKSLRNRQNKPMLSADVPVAVWGGVAEAEQRRVNKKKV